MAGIGVRLNKIFEKRSITADLVGFAYSTVATAAPMFLVILTILLMQHVLGFEGAGYQIRELFFCTVLYVFIFALLTTSPFNAVLSKYVHDAIFEERYQDILPCYYLGLVLNVGLSFLLGVPFCLWEHFVGGVGVFYVFISFCAYMCLMLVFYSMLYLSVSKDYQKISIFFLVGMVVTFLTAWILRSWFYWEIAESMLFALMVGFLLIAVMEYASVKRYYIQNSNRYKPVARYFRKWWKLVVTNFAYTLGLYIHNFVFWTTDMHVVVVKSFVCCWPYDMASCLAMFTNISATVIFIARIEMHFHEKYRAYSEAIIGGKKADIENAKSRLFRHIAGELMSLVRVQFIISAVIYLLCVVFLPQFGFAGTVMRIYPCLAAGYFILFIMYADILFLYYFDDLTGAVLASLSFCLVTLIASIFATHLEEIWYGLGALLGSLAGWTVAYLRLRWVERNMDTHIFCRGLLLKREYGPKPTSLVYEKAYESEKNAKKGDKE